MFSNVKSRYIVVAIVLSLSSVLVYGAMKRTQKDILDDQGTWVYIHGYGLTVNEEELKSKEAFDSVIARIKAKLYK